MMKKILATLLSIVTVVGLLTGCGGSSSEGSEGAASEASGSLSASQETEESVQETNADSSQEESAEGDASGAITFWYMGDSATGIQPLIDEFTDETGIQVDVQSIPWPNLSEKLLTAIASQSGPDVMQTAVSRTAELVEADAVIDMTDYVDSVEGFAKDRFFDASYESLQMGEKYYGVPWIVDVYCVLYRPDIFEAAGYMEFPTTQDEFFQACQTIHEETGITPYYIGAADIYNALSCYAYQSGSDIVTEDRTAVFNQPEYIEAMEYLESFYEAGLADRVIDGVANYVKLANGEIAACFGGTWEISQMETVEELEGKWAAALWPKGAATNDSVYAGSNLVIPSWTTNEEAAVALIEFLTRTENQLEFNKLTGSLPAVKEAWDDPSLAEDPAISVLGEQIEYSRPFPKVAEIEEIGMAALDAYERISVGEEDIQTVCDELNDTAQNILDGE